MRALKSDRKGSGFTILDTMVAAFVMIVGIVGLLAMQLVQVQAGQRSRQLTEAGALAQQQLELLQLLPPPGSALAGGDVVDARGCHAGPPLTPACINPVPSTSYTRSYTVLPTGSTSARIQVTVSWQDPDGKSHSVSLADGR